MASKHEESQQTSNSPLSQTRRTALKKVLVGTGVAAGAAALPDKWAKPIIDKVLVPAHAQTSGEENYDNHSNPPKARSSRINKYKINGTLVGNIVNLIFIMNPSYNQKTDFATPAPALLDKHYRYKATVNVATLLKAKMSPAGNPPSGPSGPITVDQPGSGCGAGPTYLGEAYVRYIDGDKMEVWIDHEWFDLFTVASLAGLEPLACGGDSDIRLKTDIHPLGVTNQGFKLYRFQYKKDPAKIDYVGIMAQDLTDSHPHALVKNDDGFYAVKYDLLGLKMATYKEWRQVGLKAVELAH